MSEVNELEVQAYITWWDDVIKHIHITLAKVQDVSTIKKFLYEDLYYKDKHYGALSYKDNLKP